MSQVAGVFPHMAHVFVVDSAFSVSRMIEHRDRDVLPEQCMVISTISPDVGATMITMLDNDGIPTMLPPPTDSRLMRTPSKLLVICTVDDMQILAKKVQNELTWVSMWKNAEANEIVITAS